MLKWWSEFREENAINGNWHYIIWNNRDIRIDNKSFFYKKYYDIGIWNVGDLHFDLSNKESYEQIAKNIKRTNFLEWTSMQHSIPANLKALNLYDPSSNNAVPSFKINNEEFDPTKRKSKDYYSLLIKKKACFPNFAQKLKLDFNLSNEDLKKAFLLPHSVAFEPYVKAFQFKVLNSILFTDSKLFKIGYRTDNLCSFRKRESETIKHFFCVCPYSNLFWKKVELYYFVLRKQQVHLTLKDIVICILTSESPY